ncbi:MAG: lipopolysaccharide biosynthesis protein [Pseudomonadota bacterium]
MTQPRAPYPPRVPLGPGDSPSETPTLQASPAATETSPAPFGARVRSAVAWRWGAQVGSQLITWTSTFMVVRLLDPTDYGLFAMCQVILTALAFLNGQSFATSLVQAADVDERRIGQVFGLLLLFAVSLCAVQIAIAPMAAHYFGEPIVADMLRLQAVMYFTVPFIALPSALLSRKLEFRRQAQANMASAVFGAVVAPSLAWLGYGVWSLVWAGIAIFVSRAVFLTLASRLWVRPVFNPAGAWDLFTFGGLLTLCQLFWIIQSQADIVIAGRVLPTYELGLYSQALFLTLIITARLLPPLNEVALAAYSELHREGKPLAPYFLKTARLVMMASAPAFIGLSLTSEAAVLTLMGEKWARTAPIVEGLALAMPAFALHLICAPGTNAMGRPKVYLFTSVCGALIMPVAFLIGISAGTMGLVHAWWIAAPLLCGITLTATLPRIALSPLALARTLAPIALACGLMSFTVASFQALVPLAIPFVSLITSAALGAGVYGVTLWLVARSEMLEAWAMLRPAPAQTSA